MILPLPDTLSGIARVRFSILRVDYAAPEASGRQGGVQAGFPVWGARMELDRIDADSADLWQAFVDRMRGRIRRFYCHDTARDLPLAHRFGMTDLTRAGGGAFDGSASSWSQAIDSDDNANVTLGGLPAGFSIAVGDYIGFKWDASGAASDTFERRTMMRAVLPATANASGQAVVTAEPPLDTALVPSGAVAHFDKPSCVMQLVPEESQLSPVGEGGTIAGGAVIGVQDLRP
ncbi:MAG: hypothetical protein AAFZ11_01020 [Pseudomonadota bacterium]